MLQDILELKSFIFEGLPRCKVIVSSLSIRTENTSTKKTDIEFINLLKNLIMHDNIKKEDLKFRGLHLRVATG